MLYQKILEEYHLLQNKIFEIREQLKTAPEGKLTCARGNNCYKWYNTVGHERTYISKSNRNLAEQLAIKKYLSVTLDQLEKEKTAIEFYLRHHADETEKAEDLLTNHSGYQDLLTSYFSPKSLKHLYTFGPLTTNSFDYKYLRLIPVSIQNFHVI